jgi:DegV family protein with EDD domain
MSHSHRPVKIVTDSAADIPAEIARELDITVVPLLVHMRGKTYRDGVDISGEAFYRELESTRSVTTTSFPALASFEEAYRRLTSEGYEVVSIHMSSRLSGTFNAALMASTADGVADDMVSAVDSRTVSMAQGWVAIRAAEAAREGKSRQEIEETANALTRKVHIFGLLDTLEFVMKSGRVGRLPGTMGTMLNIKPILTTRSNGEVAIIERIRTRRKALERLVELTAELGPLDALAVLHAADEEGAEQLLELLQPLNLPQPVIIAHIGAVLGTHIGPKGVGVGCLTK